MRNALIRFFDWITDLTVNASLKLEDMGYDPILEEELDEYYQAGRTHGYRNGYADAEVDLIDMYLDQVRNELNENWDAGYNQAMLDQEDALNGAYNAGWADGWDDGWDSYENSLTVNDEEEDFPPLDESPAEWTVDRYLDDGLPPEEDEEVRWLPSVEGVPA